MQGIGSNQNEGKEDEEKESEEKVEKRGYRTVL